MNRKLITLGLALGLANFARAASFAPVPLTTNSFNYYNVVPVGYPSLSKYCITVNIDNGTNYATGGDGWFEQGTYLGSTTVSNYGLPHGGRVFTNASVANHLHLMQNFVGNNVLFVSSQAGYGAGNLAVTDPTNYQALSFVTGAGGGGTVMNVTVQHADGTNEVFNNVKDGDWFTASRPLINSVSGVNTTNQWAWLPNARINVSAPSLDNGGTTTGSHLYSWDLGLADVVSPVTNVNFVYVSGGNTMVFGISGSIDNVNFAPVASVTGFNADGVVEASVPLPYNATMDNGTNIASGGAGANTWYETGWDLAAPLTGFPVHGSTLTSFTGKPYQMAASYNQPMSALVDTNHQVVNITPATPLSYTAFSLLVSGGNIGGANIMTNILVMQHQDGSMETNFFYGYDWFNNNSNAAVQPAFIASGRADFNNTAGEPRAVNTVSTAGTGDPRLFETQFVLQNSRSPVTNMLILYYNPSKTLSSAATTFIYAVSATAGGIPMVFNTNTIAQNVYAGGTATFNVSVTAGNDRNSTPHYQWMYSSTEYGTFAALSDGSGIAGSQTASLSVSGVSGANAGYYQCFITNTVSTNLSAPAPLTLLVSTASNLSQPADAISSFGGTTGGDGAAGVIDGTLNDYVNFGSGGSVFAGPVGFVTTPSAGNSIVTAMRFFTASSSPASDPADYLLEGSNDGVTFAAISSGSLSLSDVRNENLTDPIDVTDQVLQEVDFPNATGYNTYRVTFNNVKTNSAVSSLQVSEVQLLGALSPLPPGILVQPSGSQKLFVGETFVASVKVNGPSPYYYTWYNGSTAINGQTTATLTLNNVQVSDSGAYSCTISNIYGATNSGTVNLAVIARPAGYGSVVLNDNPIAYWRLDEADQGGPAANTGVIANDYVGSHDGVYTNVSLGLTGYSIFDADTAAGFALASTNAGFVSGVSGINFFNPTNLNTGAFSVEAWAYSPGAQIINGAGIVALGFGGGGEQFALDCGGTSNGFRFYFRDAATGAAHNAASSITTADAKWHHLVGVVDEVNSNASLYVDGVLAATTQLSTNLGVLSVTNPFSIGSRSSSSVSGFDDQFSGEIDEVALYNNALSAAQVQSHYFSAGIIPTLSIAPTNTTASEGANVTFYSLGYGSPTLSYQWWNSDGAAPTTALVGQNSTNLTFNNLTVALDGTYYQVVVSNAYGAVTSSPVLLSVVSGPPQVLPGGDLNASYVIYAGNSLVLPVSAGGSQPINYGWSYNGSPIANGGRVSGATSNVLVIANAQVVDSGTYQLFMTNSRGSGQSVQASVTVLPVLTLNGLGSGWSQNGATGLFNASNSVVLTDGGGGEARSAFYQNRVYVGGFTASFTYQSTGGADGTTFCIQNDPRGPAALGPAGGGLGYGANSQNAGTSISPSVALEFNIYSGNSVGGIGIALDTDGLVGNVTYPGSVDIVSGDPIGVTVTYLAGTATLTLTDAVAATSFTTSVPINIPSVVGTNDAYVGFTGATGGVTSTQTISNFTFVSLVPLSVASSGGNVTFSWPAEVGGYQLQSNPAVNNAAGWTTLTNIPTIIGNQNQIVLPATIGAGQFYRLVNP